MVGCPDAHPHTHTLTLLGPSPHTGHLGSKNSGADGSSGPAIPLRGRA